jgi:hypothetical protein
MAPIPRKEHCTMQRRLRAGVGAEHSIIDEVSVYRTEVGNVNAFSIEVIAPRPGWHPSRVAGAAPLEFARGP